MKLEVIGRELRSYKDKEASSEAGKDVIKDIAILHCVYDPLRKDKNSVTGRQTISFPFNKNNGLYDDIVLLDIPCTINAEISRNGRYTNLDDFEIIE